MKKLLLVLLSLALVAALVLAVRPLCTRPFGPPTSAEGTLNLYGTDPYTLDPALSGDAASNEYIIQIFSGLVTLDDQLEPEPDIAESWDVSPDALTYTFHLRRDVRFHDGRQLTASDFKYSWERAAAPATGSQTAAIYLGDIAGISDVISGKTEAISGVEVLDDYTLRVTLTAAKSYFLAKLSNVTSYVVDRANVSRGSNWWLNPNGTGPFKMRNWTKGQELVLTRFADYYGEKARLEKVAFQLLSGIPMNLYEKGDIDIAGVDSAYYYLVTDPAGSFSEELVVTPQLSLDYLIFDTSRPPFDDPNVRRALAMTVDKAKLAGLLFHGTVQPAEGVLPPGMPGFNAFLLGQPFDVARAKELLAASQYAGRMPKIVLTTSGYGAQVPRSLEAIIYDWRQYLGVEVEVRQLEPEEYLYSIQAEKDNLVSWAWNADYAHPQNFLDVLFGANSEYNVGGYASVEFNALLRQAAAEQDEAKSLELYRQAEQVLVSDAACIPLWFGESYTLIKPYVSGYKPSALGLVRLNGVSLEK